MARSTYLIALGSNRAGRAGPPRRVLAAAIAALPGVVETSRIIDSAAVGPSIRRYANAVVRIEDARDPTALLAELQRIERGFGRRRGRRWGARVLDLDIILWSGGAFAGPGLVIPHPRFRERRFVLAPLAELVPGWRDPITGRSMRQLLVRLTLRGPPLTARAHGRGP